MTLPDPSYTSGGAKWQSEQLMEQIYNIASDYERLLERFEIDLDILRDQDAIEKYAHAEAHLQVSELAFNFLKAEIMEATVNNEEFNIPIFTSHMESALAEHKNELIQIIPGEPGNVDVEINMQLLGTPDQWVGAITKARNDLGLGKIPNAKVRSKIWKEIYQIDREGGVKIHPTSDEDVTERYIGKYFLTIAERMKSIPPDIAPWWYYINYGNKVETPGEGAGTPYPENGPTNFLIKTELSIGYAFDELYNSIIREAERVYTKYLQDDYGIEGVTDTFVELEHNLAKTIGDEIGTWTGKIYTDVGKAKTHEAVETVFYNNAWYDVIKTSGGNTGLRYNLKKNL